jgi:hypothetical protein
MRITCQFRTKAVILYAYIIVGRHLRTKLQKRKINPKSENLKTIFNIFERLTLKI